MIKILFICHGNVCRSTMAEFVMKDMLKKAGLSKAVEAESAATTSEEVYRGVGNPIYPATLRELKAHGIGTPDNELGVSGKRARKMLPSDYEKFDYLIGMDGENLRDMLAMYRRDPEGKISLLLDFTAAPGEIADPWYTRDFKTTWQQVEAGCRALLTKIEESMGKS